MKNKVLLLQGLPASGKTTLSRDYVKKGYKRVSKDDLRAMLDFGEYSRENEKLINEIKNMIIDLCLIHNKNVIVDDTNFYIKHFKEIALIADINEADVSVKRLKTPLGECIERDSKRGEKSVGKKVITEMHDRYVKKN